MIPVFEPVVGDDEIAAVVEALRRGYISGTYGKTIEEFEEKFAAYCDCKYGVAVSSGTAALDIAVSAAGIASGDEVLLSSCTNVATALAAVHNGAVPVPVDSEEITWNLNLDLIEELVTSRSRVIMPVHVYGHPVDMDQLMEIATNADLTVIEDCAEAHGAKCRGRRVGSFGHMGCFSFYANKIITTGEGGMVVTNDKEAADRLRLLRNLGFSEPRFKHEVAGYSCRMTGFQAAMGSVQLSKIDEIIAEKRRVANLYDSHLQGIAELQLPVELDWAFNVYWMYAVVVKPKSRITRDQLMRALKAEGIDTRTFFCPINSQPFLQSRRGFRRTSCPIAEELWKSGFYLPSSVTLTEEKIEFIARAVRSALTALDR